MTSVPESPCPAIGVFDSGVGGLSVFAAVRDRLPGARFAYCSDNGNFPYGTKSEAEVVALTVAAGARFVRAASLNLLIVACNTASTVALPSLRAQVAVPVIGVVPAIKPAAAMSRSRTIALLATPGTIARPYTDELIRTFAGACRVLCHGSRRLVELAETKLRGETLPPGAVAAEVAPLFAQSPPEDWRRLDTVVLGCTHFPLLLDEMAAAAPWPVQWVDSSEAIAARTDYLLTERGFDPRTPRPSVAAPTAYVTRLDEAARRLAPALAARGLKDLAAL